MITIYHIEGRRSERVAWLLEELGVPYALEFIQGDILGSLLELEKYHEMRMTPIVKDGETLIIESGAILEYLLAKYGKQSGLRPAENSPAFAPYLEFLHFAEGTAMARILTDRMLLAYKDSGIPSPMPKLPGLAGSRTGTQRVMHFAENTLATRRYFAGDQFTAADIMMHFPLKLGAPLAAGTTASMADIQRTDMPYLDGFPHVKRFLGAMAERPAFQRAMKSTMPKGPPAM